MFDRLDMIRPGSPAGPGSIAIVGAGTGLGHVNKPLYPALQRAIESGVHVVMTVQTLYGYAQMYVYDTGRDLLDIGVIPLDNMIPETALMKLGWVLGHTDDHDEVMAMMRKPVSHEITDRVDTWEAAGHSQISCAGCHASSSSGAPCSTG